ncbi:fumarylacetoacetate hydrolase family protein [Muricoccus aerilatus]|uniref:fumarylacetoacetate hydrolase family protein n=1 Tax=Muricoccus aerilatus TaxID=452982 RepID=UPI0005C1AD08|nr:fumarylacetoacetate hydrolase family protein [Roseomonas aerilata]
MISWRLLTYRSDSGPRAGIAVGDDFTDAAGGTGEVRDATIIGILEDWDAAQVRLSRAVGAMMAGDLATTPLAEAVLLAPVHYPTTIYCAGANYTDHVARMAEVLGLPPDPDPHEVGLNPWHFIKPSRCAVGPDATVEMPSQKLDWEVELGLVIGRTARNVPVERALEHVAGYVVANDLSARDFVSRPGVPDGSPFKFDWVGQKCFDGSCPFGPWIVPAAAVPDPLALSIRLRVNGDLRQDSTTARMIFTPAEQIAHLSSRLTLHPGDIILTGTPMGVGAESGHFLSPGDVVEAEVEGLGTLRTIIGKAAS